MASKEYHKRYYLEHKEELSAKGKRWRDGHRNQISINKKRYYQEHKADILAKKKTYYLENSAEIKEKRVRWRKEKTGNATSKVQTALLSGKIEPQPCEICGESRAYAHHDDYSKPLEVRWLCKRHHVEWHKNNKPIYFEEEK